MYSHIETMASTSCGRSTEKHSLGHSRIACRITGGINMSILYKDRLFICHKSAISTILFRGQAAVWKNPVCLYLETRLWDESQMYLFTWGQSSSVG